VIGQAGVPLSRVRERKDDPRVSGQASAYAVVGHGSEQPLMRYFGWLVLDHADSAWFA
jgi:hypothetical protein